MTLDWCVHSLNARESPCRRDHLYQGKIRKSYVNFKVRNEGDIDGEDGEQTLLRYDDDPAANCIKSFRSYRFF